MARSQATYQLNVYTPHNDLVFVTAEIISMQYSRSVNVPGVLSFTIPKELDRSFFVRDARIEIWRYISGVGFLETQTQWFVRKATLDEDRRYLIVEAESALTLLNRRVIAYDAGSSQTTKNGLADDVIVEFVDENLGGSASDSNRDWSSSITVLGSPGAGASIHKAAARRNLLTTIQECAQQSNVNGVPMYFDLLYSPATQKLQFYTLANNRGADLTSGTRTVVFSPQYGNLTNIMRADDFSNEITYAYAAGQGQESGRNVQTASDQGRILSSPFGRIEAVVDSRQTDDNDKLIAEAETQVNAGRPLRTFSGRIISTPQSLYGIDWNWGDKVRIEIDGEVLTARINTINISVAAGRETITADIRVDD